MGYYDNYLEHGDRSWKNHKYISRKKVNGRWVYTYNNPEARNYRQDQIMDLSTREMYTKSKSPQYKDELGMYDNIDDLISTLEEKRSNNAELVNKANGITSKHTYSDNVKKYDEAIAEANEIKKEEEDLANNPTILKKLKHIRHSDELYHHGILGQKWGVRRFQNRDGSLTTAGKARVVSKTNKKHDFVDKSDVSIDRRKETLNNVLGMWGATSATAAMGAAMGFTTGTGPLGALIGAGFLSAPIALVGVAATTDFAIRDAKAKKANAKEKKFEEERAQNPIDKKTGFHKKTKEMTPEEDMERVNPAYKNWDDNTKSNCVLCTMSYELRRRGYDVQAKKATSGYNATDLTKDWFIGAKEKTSEGSMSDAQIIEMRKKYMSPTISKENQKKMIENTVNEVKSQKDGARGQMAVTWNGTLSGHSIAYANEGGKFVIYDTQANERYEDKAAENYLKKCSQVYITRLDNCDMNTKYIKEVAK